MKESGTNRTWIGDIRREELQTLPGDNSLKWNFYNWVAEVDDNKYILYNSLTDRILSLTKKQTYLLHEPVDVLAGADPEMYKQLIDKEFVVSKGYNEKEMAVARIQADMGSSHYFELIINPTLNCNLKCWYCYESHIKGSYIKKNVLDAILLFIKTKIEAPDLDEMMISFFGGEPLLEFNRSVWPIIEFAQKLCQIHRKKLYISFVTNGVLLKSDIVDKLYKANLNCVFQVTFDGDRSFHDKIKKTSKGKGTFDVIVENIMYGLSKGNRFIVRYNYTAENMRTFREVTSLFTAYAAESIHYGQLIFSYHKVWQENELREEMPLSDKISEKNIQDTSFDICYADRKNSIVVNYDGNIYKCTARDFKKDNREGYLNEQGEIVYNNNYYRRFLARYSNRTCLDCCLFPICNICSQITLEKGKEKITCFRNLEEEDKKKILLKRIRMKLKV